mmetsp:Transcript_8931/g.26829  ORF Transcript_8931/g.26829 Transcript_8931/m.26829 type:complete len:374 (-) Transcript_8931:7-1128(-)
MGAVPLVDLRKEKEIYGDEVHAAIDSVLGHGGFIMGREVRELEAKLQEYCGARHCIAVASGTDALLLALMALQVGPGDEVITTPFTWISSAEVAAFLKAKVVYADIDPDTFCIDVEELGKKISPKTKAIIPVSLFGQVADIPSIQKVAGDVPVIEDGAQSFGAVRGGFRSCGDSAIATTSFFPTKPLACYGDGGAVFTSDASLATVIRALRVHGKDPVSKLFSAVGMNSRLDTMQAAVLLVKLRHLDDALTKRIAVAERYNGLLCEVDDVVCPVKASEEDKHVFAVYTIRILGGEERRDAVQKHLTDSNIGNAVYYSHCVHQQPAYSMFDDEAFPHAEKATTEVLSLPMHPFLTAADQDHVVATLKAALAQFK